MVQRTFPFDQLVSLLAQLTPTRLLAIALTFTLLSCTSADEATVSETPAIAEQPTAEQLTDEEAKELAEWKAQQEKTRAVLSSLDRETLIAESSTKGPKDADVVMLKFSDFECPFCAQAAVSMKDFTETHDDVLYVYKQLPLESIHPEAMPAAKASWAAGQQGEFWLYHDGLFAGQNELGEDYYISLAEQIGLDVEQFNRDRNSTEAAAAIEKDIQLARELDLRGTPTLILNGLTVPGNAPPEFLDEAVARAKAGTLFE